MSNPRVSRDLGLGTTLVTVAGWMMVLGEYHIYSE